MLRSEEEVNSKFEQAFNSRVAEQVRLSPFALSLTFENLTDVSSIFSSKAVDCNASYLIDSSYRDLFEGSSVYVFHNAYVSRRDAESSPSSKLDSFDNTLMQDFFHRDVFNVARHSHLSVLYNPDNIDRIAPTLYALEKSVRKAMVEIAHVRPDLYKNIKRQLQELADNDNYHFTSIDGEAKPRKIIEEFADCDVTKEIYDLMPDADKLEVAWNTRNQVVIHSNFTDVLHARPICGDRTNPLKTTDLIFE